MIEIPTERLLLRSPRLEDATALLALYSDPEVMTFMGGVRPAASADPALIVRQWLERWEANGYGHLVVARRSDAALLGRVGLAVWDTRDWRIKTLLEAGEHAQPELGWALARAHWGYGYATEAALAARRWAREGLRIDRLISVIAPDTDARSVWPRSWAASPTRLSSSQTSVVPLSSGSTLAA